jgi:hypothetical protein
MKKILLPIALLILTSCASTSEPAINGAWDFAMSSPFGAVEANVTMAVSGASLSGQFDLGGGRTLAIEDGSVEGNTINFTIQRDGAAMTYGMSGTLEGDNITGIASAMGAEVPWTMTRGG